MMDEVKIWQEWVKIPTYGVGEPEKNPVFLEKRVYQGSCGAVYPHPVIEKILDQKRDREWIGLFLENAYLKIMILPELGGRVQMAYDKIKQRHFVYYNEVIKPALVGLTGPWISGGIEFNWPQHHRPSTFDALDFDLEENPDGSKTVWCSELERMFRTKGMAGFTLSPGKAYLEIRVKLYNRTSEPQTFLWWANPAVHVHDHYQSVFPPDVHAVFDHGKRDVSSFPIATGRYYKVDYSAGVDISKYKNIPVPTSYMAVESKYDFVGGYENDSRGGLLHVANHHHAPGKKQWTWGNSDFGLAWDRNLTDRNGPYIELMCGVYTDNQPDFSWIMPYEEKSFSQYFMPYRDVGMVKNATRDAMVNLEFEPGKAIVKAYTTGVFNRVVVRLEGAQTVYLSELVDFSPVISYEKAVDIDPSVPIEQYHLRLIDSSGKTLVDYRPEPPGRRALPEPARAARPPQEIASIEQLFLCGLHLEQYRHATFAASDYYREALRREPGDVRNNNAMGLLLFRRAQFAQAEPHFRTAIETLTQRNPNPYDGEPYYNLGLCLFFQERYDEAYGAFYKAVWNAAWQDSAYFMLAKIASRNQNHGEALELVDRALIRNGHNHKARHLKTALLRKLGRHDEAASWAKESLALDHFNMGLHFENILLCRTTQGDERKALDRFSQLLRGNIHNYIEYSLDYAHAGMYPEAIECLETGLDKSRSDYPSAWYFLGWYHFKSGDGETAARLWEKAEAVPPGHCFPSRLEEAQALSQAIRLHPGADKAPYYLGNFWYANRQYNEALECWERSCRLNDRYPTVHRNLSLIYYNQNREPEKARKALETAFALDPRDARVLMELDQLYKKMGVPHEQRLKLLEDHPDCTEHRDDLFLERVSLYNHKGDFDKALALIMSRKFHPWEGGEGRVSGQYLLSHTELAKRAIEDKRHEKAIEHLKATERYPHNLGEGKLFGVQENDIHYWMGQAYEGLGQRAEAIRFWEKASVGLSEPTPAVFYNDQQPDKIFYQGLALLKLERRDEAIDRFDKLIGYGEEHMDDEAKIDYFAVSLPDLLIWDEDPSKRNRIHCLYLTGLGLMGKGERQKARERFERLLTLDPYHQGARIHLSALAGELSKTL